MLVGETGHGKSQLANFLADVETCLETEDAPTGRRLPFVASPSSDACTQGITSAQFDFNNKQFSVVDTPGYGESKEEKDLEHVLQAVEYLKKNQEVSAIVFCFRYIWCSMGPTSCMSSWYCPSLVFAHQHQVINQLVVTHLSQ